MESNISADKVFYERQSPREFKDKPVDEESLVKLLEAARWAPSSYNEQPWRFIYALKNSDNMEGRYEKLFSSMNEFNQDWAKEAPVLLMTAAKTDFSKNGKPNPHAWHDVGLAMGNFCMQATKMDLVVHQMAGFSPEKAVQLFDLPENIEPVAMVAIGYPDDKKTDRERKPLEELILN